MVKLNEILKGLCYFVMYETCFTVQCLMVKTTMKHYYISVAELCYTYSILVIPFLFLTSRMSSVDLLEIPLKLQKDLLLRCITGCACDLLMFYAYHYTSYSKALCLFFTNTLYCPFLAAYMLGERVKTWDVVAIVFGFTGMLLLV